MTKKIRVTLFCRILVTIYSESRAQGETRNDLRMQKILHSFTHPTILLILKKK